MPRADMTSAHQQLLLQALQYKITSSVDTLSQHTFRALVVWLEHTQVMHASAHPARYILKVDVPCFDAYP